MADTSYNPDFAPFARTALAQAPVPASVHNLPSSIPATSSVLSSLIVTEGFLVIAAGIKTSQNGTMTIQRYLDAGGTVPQGALLSVALTANTAANLNALDGLPFASFQLTVTNSSGSVSTISNFALLLQANSFGSSGSSSLTLTGNTTNDGSTTITTGGTAQNLFGGVTPTDGYSVCNPDPTNDLWVSDSTTAAANGQGSLRVAANGGYYATENGQKPIGAVSVFGAVTAQKITARRW